ncbi:RNA polymerase sigma factor [Fodinicola feengrottensis]|uniref:Sigma-70 family RNA polymerase sigma factor n=1 Tax=Fodinicola feengrottensis TaxID=435914 RepID=A0ABN2GKE9_9ACTN|nr:RNA polymerase sigma factor [Fodinicola feengrottensis]
MDDKPRPKPAASSATRDRELIALISAGNSQAFDQLYNAYADVAWRFAYQITGIAETAEEVVQDVLLAVWRHPERFNGARGTVRGWMMGAVHHKAVDYVRRSAARQRLHGILVAAHPHPVAKSVEEQVFSQFREQQVWQILRQLSSKQRVVLILAYYRGHTQGEIALILGIPLGTVKTRTHAAMHRLADVLREAQVDNRLT